MAKHRKKEATDDFSELTDEELRQHASAAQQEFYRREKAKSVQNTLVVDDTAEPEESTNDLSGFTNVELTMELFHRGLGVYTSQAVLGKEYRMKRFGLKGWAVAIHFSENGCTRVMLDYLKNGDLARVTADDVELEELDGTALAGSGAQPGGPMDLTHEEVENQSIAWFMTGDE